MTYNVFGGMLNLAQSKQFIFYIGYTLCSKTNDNDDLPCLHVKEQHTAQDGIGSAVKSILCNIPPLYITDASPS